MGATGPGWVGWAGWVVGQTNGLCNGLAARTERTGRELDRNVNTV